MKKIFYAPTILFVLFFADVKSQTEKGRIIAGGPVNFDYYNQDGPASPVSIVRVSPYGAYLPINNLAIGFALDIESIKTNGTTLTSSSAGPLLRYYAPCKYKMFLQAAYFFKSNKLSDTLTVTSNSFIGTVGYALFLNSHISLEPQFYYRMDNSKDNEKGKGYGFAIGLTAYFGEGKKEK